MNFNEAETLISLPAIIARRSMIASESEATPKTDKITISPMRLVSIQATMREAEAPVPPRTTLKSALSQVFMVAMAWFHSHDEITIDPQLTRALLRLRDGGRGLFVSDDLIFEALRLVATSPAGKDAEVAKAVQAAEQALLQ